MNDATTDADSDAPTEFDDSDASGRRPPYACDYCGRPFAREEWLALHRGQEHESRLTDSEREAFASARDAEEEDLRLFRLKALLALVVVYFGFIMLYSFAGA